MLDEDGLREQLGVLRWHLGRLLENGDPALVVDVSRLTSLSSATVAVLLRARRFCRARGGRLVLDRPHRNVLSVLRRSGLEDLFETTDGPEIPTHVPATAS